MSSPLETILVALAGAALALLATSWLGLDVRIWPTLIVTGPAAFVVTALAGAFTAIVLRLAVRNTFGF